MGAGMSSYDDDYYYNRRVIYPNRRIIYVTSPNTILVPQANLPHGVMPMPMNPNTRIIINNSPNMPNGRIIMNPIPYGNPNVHGPLIIRPMPFPGMPLPIPQQKKTIPNLKEIFGETKLTQSILDKGEQKSCSICLENFELGTNIIYLPCFHYYHAQCIETWVKNSDKCPLCNLEIKIPQ